MELVPGFHWIDTGAANVYLCVDEDGLTLVDAAMPGKTDLIFNYLSRVGHHQSDIRRILITHADRDHAGSLADLQARTGATVFAGALTADLLRQGKSPAHMPRLVQWILDRWPYAPVDPRVIEILTGGDGLPVLGGLQVLPTPGHTLDHHAFYSPTTGILLAGDALNTRRHRLQVTPPAITADMAAARRSARRLLELAPAVLACGHGPPLHGHKDEVLLRLARQLD